MKLLTGTIYAGIETPVGEGVNAPVRGTVLVDGELRAAVLKRIPPDAVLAECFCALMLRGWGLPVPEPVLVTEGETLAFASLDAGYPSLKQRMGWKDDLPDMARNAIVKICASIVCSWRDAPLALTADEAIANNDRNLGNFLWDGDEHAYIDHERTMGRVSHEHNMIALMAQWAGKQDAVQAGAVSAALALPRYLHHDIHAEGVDFSGLSEYLEKRLPALATRVLNRFPKPKDLFSDAAHDP